MLSKIGDSIFLERYCNCINCNQTFIQCYSAIQRSSRPKSVTNKAATNKNGFKMLSEEEKK